MSIKNLEWNDVKTTPPLYRRGEDLVFVAVLATDGKIIKIADYIFNLQRKAWTDEIIEGKGYFHIYVPTKEKNQTKCVCDFCSSKFIVDKVTHWKYLEEGMSIEFIENIERQKKQA